MKETTLSNDKDLSASDKRYIDHQGNSHLMGNKNTNLNGENSAYKHQVDEGSTQHKRDLIEKLNQCNYRTPPKKIALLLSDLVKHPDTLPTHWLYIAQRWSPREINKSIKELIKLHRDGWATIDNPARYLTFLIKRRKKR